MTGFRPLFLGILGTFMFSWIGLTMVPNAQIGHLDPQTDDEGGDAYPVPKSGMAERGRKVYVANGCVYCHTQQVRPDYAASDIDRKWGERRSAPRDYIFDRPALLGRMRMGPDLANVGKRAPADDANAPAPSSVGTTPGGDAGAPVSAAAAAPATENAAATPPAGQASPAPATAAPTADVAVAPMTSGSAGTPAQYSPAWHHRHLYAPRSITFDSTMPAYRFLYEKRRIGGQAAADAVQLDRDNSPEEGWEIIPSYDAKCLVAYLMSLDQSHPLKEVKSAAPASPAAPGKAAK